jgi:hypothetical protein
MSTRSAGANLLDVRRRYRTVRGILERDLDRVPPEPNPPPTRAGAFLRGLASLLATSREGR